MGSKMGNNCLEKSCTGTSASRTLLRYQVGIPVGWDARRLFQSMWAIEQATGLHCRSEEPIPGSNWGLSGDVFVSIPPEKMPEIDEIRANVERSFPGLVYKGEGIDANTKVAQ